MRSSYRSQFSKDAIEVCPTLKDLIFQEKKTTLQATLLKAVLFSDVPTWAIRNWVASKQSFQKLVGILTLWMYPTLVADH